MAERPSCSKMRIELFNLHALLLQLLCRKGLNEALENLDEALKGLDNGVLKAIKS